MNWGTTSPPRLFARNPKDAKTEESQNRHPIMRRTNDNPDKITMSLSFVCQRILTLLNVNDGSRWKIIMSLPFVCHRVLTIFEYERWIPMNDYPVLTFCMPKGIDTFEDERSAIPQSLMSHPRSPDMNGMSVLVSCGYGYWRPYKIQYCPTRQSMG